MTRKQIITLVIIAVFSVWAGFFGTRNFCRCRQGDGCWISTTTDFSPRLDKLDADTREMTSHINKLHKEFCAIAAEPSQADSVVIEKLEEISAAHQQLVRKIFSDVISLRKVLPESDKQRLMDVCSQLLSQPKSELLRRNNACAKGIRARGGDGRGGRHCMGVEQRLALTDAQIATLNDADPLFKQQSADITKQLLEKIDALRMLIENPDASESKMLAALEEVLEEHGRLERRTLAHILKIKPYLNSSQKDALRTMCGKCKCGDAVE